MRVLTFSDLHFFSERRKIQEDTCKWIADQIISRKPDLVVNCGDTNHTHGYVDVDTLDSMVNSINLIYKAACKTQAQVVFLSGNHDQASKDGSENVLSVFSSLGITCVTTRPRVIQMPGCDYLRLGFAPYPPSVPKDRVDYMRELAGLLPVDILFSHWEITGVPYGPHIRKDLKNTSHAVRPTDLGQIGLIVNGHYHHPDDRREAGKRVLIVGSPCYYNYSDSISGEPRGLLWIDTEEDEEGLCPLFGGDSEKGYRVWVENPHGNVYHTEDLSRLPDFLKDCATGALPCSNLKERLNLRVRLESTDSYKNCEPLLTFARNAAKSVKVVGDFAVEHQDDVVVTSNLDSKHVVAEYLVSATTALDRAKLLDIGVALVEEAAVAVQDDPR